jgi:hypothetical protein
LPAPPIGSSVLITSFWSSTFPNTTGQVIDTHTIGGEASPFLGGQNQMVNVAFNGTYRSWPAESFSNNTAAGGWVLYIGRRLSQEHIDLPQNFYDNTARIDTGIASVNTSLSGNVSRIDTAISNVNTAIGLLASNVSSMNTSLSTSISTSSSAASSNVSRIDTGIASVNTSLSGNVSRIDTAISSVNSAVSTLQTNVATLFTNASSQQTSITQLQGNVTTLLARKATHQNASTAADVPTIVSDFNALLTRLQNAGLMA